MAAAAVDPGFYTHFGPFGEAAVLPLLDAKDRKPTFTSIPVIDFSVLQKADLAARETLIQELLTACQDVGFFYARGHGVDQKVVQDASRELDAFFALSEQEKMKVHWHKNPAARGYEKPFDMWHEQQGKGDMKEAFAFSIQDGTRDRNLWPTDRPAFREALVAYHCALTQFASKLHGMFALALGLPEDFFTQHYAAHKGSVRCLRYPPQEPQSGAEEVGIGAHTDASCFTLVLQDDVGGLEVQNANGEWVPALPKPGTFIVNIGDYLQFISGGKLHSTRHRVVNRKGHERRSIAFFWSPNADDVLQVAGTCQPSPYDGQELLVKQYSSMRLKGSRLSHPLIK